MSEQSASTQQSDAETFLPGLKVGDVETDGGLAYLTMIAPHANASTCRLLIRINEIEWIDE